MMQEYPGTFQSASLSPRQRAGVRASFHQTQLKTHPSESGSAVLVLLAFLTLMLMLSAATSRAVYMSRQEINLINKRQLARLAASTNAPQPSPSRPAGAP